MKSNLLKEAIADAKAVRETAIANAKIALEEAFTPRLQSMLSKKIEEELDNEEEEVETVEEQSDSSQIGNGDNKVDVADGDDEEKSETEKQSATLGAEGEDTTVDKLTEVEGEDEEKELEEAEEAEVEDDEIDAELAEIIRELEGEDDETTEGDEYAAAKAEDETMEEDEMAAPVEDEETEYTEEENMEDDEAAAPAEDETTEMYETEEDEEDLNIESILKALQTEEDGEDEDEEMVPESRLREAYNVIKSLKSTLQEVNLLNAKLLFSNRIFKSQSLTESQKMRVIETFDRAHSLREVKLVYTTLAESLKPSKGSKKTLRTEGSASKVQKSTRPKTVIAEGNDMANRMKKLAGLL
jgi:hypothetical protein